jgi:hypothetical protein
LDVEAGLIDGAVVDACHTLVNVCERPGGSVVKVNITEAVSVHPGLYRSGLE